MVKFSVITLFPELIHEYAQHSMMKRAAESGKVTITAVNPRDFTEDKHKTADDRPYGGGPGMVLKAEPVLKAVEAALSESKVESQKLKVLILSPHGKQFTNEVAQEFSTYENIVLIAGHYEGMDARIGEALRDTVGEVDEVSVGPYVLTGGELPALTIIDAVARQIPGVLGKEESLEEKRTAPKDTYTRPESFEWKGKEYSVPDVLLTGHHAEIEKWREKGSNLPAAGRES